MQQKNIGNLNCYVIENKDGDTPSGAVLLLHGYGADGRDLISIADMWAERFRNLIFIAPDAPTQCEESPFGKQWFSLLNYDRDILNNEIKSTAPVMNELVNGINAEYGIPQNKIVLSGFSQGCMVALETALYSQRPFCAVLGYSGMLLNSHSISQSKNKQTPIHLIHGTADTVVPAAEWNDATKILEQHGFPVTGYKTKGLDHSIDFQGIDSGLFFINEVFQ